MPSVVPPDQELGLDLRVGTSGWSYPDWVGPFYPRGTPTGGMLERYARVFDTVEVNSTFYAVPPRDRVAAWAEATPEGFTFSVKAPTEFTHEARLDLALAGEVVDAFVRALSPLGAKLDTVLLQLPPSLAASEGLDRLAHLLEAEPFPAPLALEARHDSWDDQEVYELLRQHRVTWCWSENRHWTTPPVLTTGRAYLRLIGDREIERFHQLQRDPEPQLRRWWQRLEERHDELSAVSVYANNHFAGFGPGTANAFLRIAGREPRTWRGSTGTQVQRELDEFGG